VPQHERAPAPRVPIGPSWPWIAVVVAVLILGVLSGLLEVQGSLPALVDPGSAGDRATRLLRIACTTVMSSGLAHLGTARFRWYGSLLMLWEVFDVHHRELASAPVDVVGATFFSVIAAVLCLSALLLSATNRRRGAAGAIALSGTLLSILFVSSWLAST
jgi:hypothetical protein